MKERTRGLFELAEGDLKVATSLIETMPNVSCFHAQQCAEKALKAMVWELSDTEDEDELRNRIAHDSIRAVTKVLTQTIKESMRRSEYQNIAPKLKKLEETPENRLALVLLLAATTTFDNVFMLFETMPLSKNEDYWGQSLEENLKPDPVFNRKWIEQLDKAGEFTETLLSFLFSIRSGTLAPNAVPVRGDPAGAAKVWLEATFRDMDSKGRKTEAEATKKAMNEVQRFANPESGFVEWMKLVIFWTPYLDAHAIRARYASTKELKKYQTHLGGVRNLVSISAQVLEKSKAALTALQ